MRWCAAVRVSLAFGAHKAGPRASRPTTWIVALRLDYDVNNLHRLIYVATINVLIDIDIESDTENSRKLVGRHTCGAAECGGLTLEEM